MSRRASAALVACLVLAACRHTPEMPSDGQRFAERRPRLQAIAEWDMRGRIAVETPDEAWQGRFFWTQSTDSLNLLIRGPLGAGNVEISGTETDLTVRSRGETWQLEDAELELSARLGWWVPITSLDSWLKGIPDAEYDARPVISRDALASLEQRAWTLRYESYQLIDDWLIPRRIDMTHEALKLIVTIDSFAPRTGAASGLN
jgi:outer membrane lipoprotein LolB